MDDDVDYGLASRRERVRAEMEERDAELARRLQDELDLGGGDADYQAAHEERVAHVRKEQQDLALALRLHKEEEAKLARARELSRNESDKDLLLAQRVQEEELVAREKARLEREEADRQYARKLQGNYMEAAGAYDSQHLAAAFYARRRAEQGMGDDDDGLEDDDMDDMLAKLDQIAAKRAMEAAGVGRIAPQLEAAVSPKEEKRRRKEEEKRRKQVEKERMKREKEEAKRKKREEAELEKQIKLIAKMQRKDSKSKLVADNTLQKNALESFFGLLSGSKVDVPKKAKQEQQPGSDRMIEQKTMKKKSVKKHQHRTMVLDPKNTPSKKAMAAAAAAIEHGPGYQRPVDVSQEDLDFAIAMQLQEQYDYLAEEEEEDESDGEYEDDGDDDDDGGEYVPQGEGEPGEI